MRARSQLLAALCLVLAVTAPFAGGAATPEPPWNIVMIVLDDLNARATRVGGAAPSVTPNIDRLAAEGVSFRYAYAPAAACNPSRAAVWSGLRPSTSGVYRNDDKWYDVLHNVVLPRHLRKHGYYTLGTGKLFHNGAPGHSDAVGDYWDVFEAVRPHVPEAISEVEVPGTKIGWRVVKNADESKMGDAGRARWAEEKLGAKLPQPFFLAVGFVKPHLPFAAPERFYDAIPLDSVELPPAAGDPAVDPATARPRRASEHRAIVEAGLWKDAVRAYLASTAYVDAQVGRVLDALRTSAYAERTLVVLWADHGMHLGEQEIWRKGALSEEATRTPYVFKVPGTKVAGQVSDAPVDLMSLYPTLLELNGLPRPGHALEGVSLVPLLSDPGAVWDGAAVTTHGRGNHAVRKGPWRYVVHVSGASELYDVSGPAGARPNLVSDPEHAALVESLRAFVPRK